MRFHLAVRRGGDFIDALTGRFEAMEAATKPATAASLTSLIRETEERHSQDIQKLMDIQTKDHISRVLDAYQSVDGVTNPPELEVRCILRVYAATLTSTANSAGIHRPSRSVRHACAHRSDVRIQQLPVRAPADHDRAHQAAQRAARKRGSRAQEIRRAVPAEHRAVAVS